MFSIILVLCMSSEIIQSVAYYNYDEFSPFFDEFFSPKKARGAGAGCEITFKILFFFFTKWRNLATEKKRKEKTTFFLILTGRQTVERVLRVFDFAFQTEVLIKLQSKLQTPPSGLGRLLGTYLEEAVVWFGFGFSTGQLALVFQTGVEKTHLAF